METTKLRNNIDKGLYIKKLQCVSFIVSVSKAALSRRKPGSVETFRDSVTETPCRHYDLFFVLVIYAYCVYRIM
jgi:hypothetical protein